MSSAPLDIFFRCAHIKPLYIDINGIASYRISYKKYIDISYKLDIPPSPTIKLYQISDTETAQPELYNVTSLFPDANNESLPAPLSSYTAAAERSRRAGGPADEVQMWRLGHVLVPASPACQIMVALDSVHTAHGTL